MKTKNYYFVPDDCYGQHGSNILELNLTKQEYQQINATRIYQNMRGFITDKYISALYYTQD